MSYWFLKHLNSSSIFLDLKAIANAMAEWKESPTADDHTTTYVGRLRIAQLEDVKVGHEQFS